MVVLNRFAIVVNSTGVGSCEKRGGFWLDAGWVLDGGGVVKEG